MRRTTLVFLFSLAIFNAQAQLPDSCKLSIGTNLGGLADYGTEIPFVNLMKTCRTWYTKNSDGTGGFDTQLADSIAVRPDGYPTKMPQNVNGQTTSQIVSTIWANTDGWTPGRHVILFDGVGVLQLSGGADSVALSSANRMTFVPNIGGQNYIELKILSSSAANPVRNIRVLMPGTEFTYATQPFNPIWLNKALVFKSFRFMDWTQTNNWGQKDQWDWDSPSLYNWSDRAKMDNYTWANNKGIPYEMTIKLMNDYDVDGWICVPHRASNQYIDSMATMFHTRLEPQHTLTVEYSNEIWNWMFGQAQWCNKYGGINSGLGWPECIAPLIQNCLDRWTAIYGADLSRIKRAVGIQTGWLDVAQRTAYNVNPASFDVVAPTYYFGLGSTADSTLDAMGATATAADIAYWARQTRNTEEKVWINDVKRTIVDSLQKEMAFYEGGQHLTPTPFGEPPTYENALLAIQRDTALYNLYNEWYDYVRTLQSGNKPLQLMNFSFVSTLSARYGSWGILETMNQDTNLVYAPKYSSTIKNMAKGNCFSVSALETSNIFKIKVFPNPVCTNLFLESSTETIERVQILAMDGKQLMVLDLNKKQGNIDVSGLASGSYILKVMGKNGSNTFKVIKK